MRVRRGASIPIRASRLAVGRGARTLPRMEFGWWETDDEGKKWNVSVRYHAGHVTFSRKTGHHTGWTDFDGNEEQWDRLLKEAEKRLPRRLMSQKEFVRLKACRPQ